MWQETDSPPATQWSGHFGTMRLYWSRHQQHMNWEGMWDTVRPTTGEHNESAWNHVALCLEDLFVLPSYLSYLALEASCFIQMWLSCPFKNSIHLLKALPFPNVIQCWAHISKILESYGTLNILAILKQGNWFFFLRPRISSSLSFHGSLLFKTNFYALKTLLEVSWKSVLLP